MRFVEIFFEKEEIFKGSYFQFATCLLQLQQELRVVKLFEWSLLGEHPAPEALDKTELPILKCPQIPVSVKAIELFLRIPSPCFFRVLYPIGIFSLSLSLYGQDKSIEINFSIKFSAVGVKFALNKKIPHRNIGPKIK